MLTLYYMRDNHTFRELLPGKELEALREEYAAGNTCGMLCGYKNKVDIRDEVHAGPKAEAEKFFAEAEIWIKKHRDAAVESSPIKHEPKNYEFSKAHACVLFTKKVDCKGIERSRLYVQSFDAYRHQLELTIEQRHRAGDLDDLYWELHAYRHPGVRNIVELSEKDAVALTERFLELCDNYPELLFNPHKTLSSHGSSMEFHVPINEGFVRFHTQLLDGYKPSVKLLQ